MSEVARRASRPCRRASPTGRSRAGRSGAPGTARSQGSNCGSHVRESHRPGWSSVTTRARAGDLVRDARRPTPRLSSSANLGREPLEVSARSSGSTRISPTTGMKLVSPLHLGTTCQCRCSGMPAPAGRTEVQADVEPVRRRFLAQGAHRPLQQRLQRRALLERSRILDVARVAHAARSAGGPGCTGTSLSTT